MCVCARVCWFHFQSELVRNPVRLDFFFENPGWLTEKIARSAARAADRCASVEPVQGEWVCVPFPPTTESHCSRLACHYILDYMCYA